MATSGSVNFIITRDDIIKYALLNVGAIGDGDTPTSNQYTDGAFYLNMIMKAWHNDGMPLWALKEGYILPIADTNTISLGPSGGHATLSYVHTTISADEASGQTTISLTATTGMSASDNIGVELDDGTIQWTTISGAPTSTTALLATALTGAASEGNHVYTYTTKIQRPLKILEAQRMDSTASTESPIDVYTHNEYFEQSDKTTEGQVLKLWYNPQLLNGIVSIWPRFQDGDDIIKIWFHRPFEDFDATGDNPDCPQEFYMALVWELSWALSPGWGVPLDERKMFLQEAAMLKAQALSFNQEEGSVRISPSYGW